MNKPSFTVVTCVLVVFVILAFARHFLVGLVPPVTTNPLAKSHQKFLQYAGHEEIEWHVLDKGAFAKAQSSKKPILLVIGVSSSKLGRDFDSSAFEDVDTARFVAQNFFCIRIDGYEHPEWLNALLPISRLRLELTPGFQVWTLDSSAHVLSFIGRTYANGQLDTGGIFKALIDARSYFDTIASRSAKNMPVPDMQAEDLNYFSTHPGVDWPSLSAYGEVLLTRCGPAYGGFPHGELQELYPNAWRFLTLTGYKSLWHDSLGPLLTSKLVDIQDGGFFRLGLTKDVSLIEFGKGTRQNAEMMLALALQGQVEHDEFYKYLAESTFDWLTQSEMRNGLLAACQEDDENPQGRSPRLSFPNWRLRDLLDSNDRAWAEDQLGLNPMSNAQMAPYLKSRDSLLKDRTTYDRVLGLMRAGSTTEPTFNDAGYLDVNGHSVARMLEVARLWGDTQRLESLRPLIARLAAFNDSTDLVHWAKDEDQLLGYLGDYLAISDERLQEYLATGQPATLQVGLHYLNLALKKFQGARPGELNLNSSVAQMGGFPAFCVPEIADNMAESCTAQAIRLELAYARLTADTPEGQDLLRSARQTTAVFAEAAGKGGPGTGGYFCAAADILDDRYAVAVGPQAQTLADDLYRRVPTRFVAPAAGPFRRDLQFRRPGIYLIGKAIRGPFTVDQAAHQLPLALVGSQAP